METCPFCGGGLQGSSNICHNCGQDISSFSSGISTGSRKKPTRVFFGAAMFFFITGIVACGIVIIVGVISIDAFIKVLVPGKIDMYLEEVRNYTVYLEYKSELDGKPYFSNWDSLAEMEFLLKHKRSGNVVAISPSSVNSTYQFGNREGKSFMEFTINNPGEYEFSAVGDDNGRKAMLTIGKDFGMKILKAIGAGFGTFVIFGILGGLMLVLHSRITQKGFGDY